MRKAALLTAAVILIASGVAVAMKWSEPAADAPALRTAVVVTGQPPAAPTMKIVPAPAIDTHAEVFVGTGDGSGGGWTKP